MFHQLRAAAIAASATVAALLAATAPAAEAATGVVPAHSRVDFAVDTNHHVLFIGNKRALLRYDLDTHHWLASVPLGGITMGMDISRDGRKLAVANASNDGSNAWVDVVMLASLTTRRFTFPLASGETGTYSVAWDAQGQILVSGSDADSGWVPLRKIDPQTGAVTILGSVRADTMLTASADHQYVAIAESNISSGPYGRYATGDTSYASAYGTSWYGWEIGISPDGSQMAVPTFDGTFIHDATNTFGNVGTYARSLPIGVAYAPAGHVVYFPFSGTSYIAAYDTGTMTEISRIPVPTTFAWVGNHAYSEGRTKVSSDGSLLCSTVVHGVFCTAITPASSATR